MVSKIRQQIYIEAEQDNLLKESARRTGLSEAEIIRRAIDWHISPVNTGLENQNLLSQLHNLSRDEKLKLIKFLLQDLGTKNADSDQTLLSQLAGTWTEADEMDFLQNTEAFRAVEESWWS